MRNFAFLLMVLPALVLGQVCRPAFNTDPAAATGTFTSQPSSVPGETIQLIQATTLILWSTKNGPATTLGDTTRPKALGASAVPRDVLFAFPVSSGFQEVERGVDHIYTASFSARQDGKNTIVTASSAPTTYADISVGFVPNDIYGNVTSDQVHFRTVLAIQNSYNMTKATSTPSGRSVTNFYTFSTSSTSWNDYSVTFTPSTYCSNCSLVIRFSVGAANKVTGTGNTYLVDNVVLKRAPIAAIPARTPTDGIHERAILRYPAPVAITARTMCPFADASVKLWHNAATWGAAGVPRSGGVVLPENTKVLIQGCSLASATGPFAITIPETSSLVFDDADIELHITQIFVFGSLQIGSETCRLWGRIKIVFHGIRADVLSGQTMRAPSYKLPSKGIVAIGGTIDMHGKLFDRSWTRLAFTAYAGEDRITLQHPVNWAVGMDVAVLTSTYIDKPTDHKNDVVRILALSADKTTVIFSSKLQFDHYAGPEYQVEAGLLNRTITLTSVDSESAADKYGGHVLVTENGVGRFSGVETYKMGQQNVMGRYPIHFHMLDNTDIDKSSAIVVDAPSPAVTVTGPITVYGTTDSNQFQFVGSQYYRLWRYAAPPTVVTYSFGSVTQGQYRVFVSFIRDSTALTSVPVNVTIGTRSANFTFDQTQKDPSDTRKKWQLVGTITVPTGGAPVTVKISNEGTGPNQPVVWDAVQIARVNPNRSYVRDSSTRDSYWRCVTIHGTNGVKLSRNFGFNIQGSCYYLEDGVEERNVIEYNVAAHVHPIGTPAAGDGQFGNDFVQSDDLQNPTDSAASGFYISNARNWFYGNAASGGWVGYGFPNLPKPIGMYAGEDYPSFNPWQRKELSFDGNTAHSAGSYWVSGSCLYVASSLTLRADGLLTYNSGRIARQTFDTFGVLSSLRFSNTIFSLCNRALQHWGINVEVINYESHDNAQGARLFGDVLVNNTLFNAHSGNDKAAKLLRWYQYDGVDYNRIGFQFYDVNVRTILLGITFRNFWLGDQILIPMYHMDTFKPEAISAVKNIRYENVVSSSIVFAFRANKDTGAAYNYNVADFDGTTFLQPGPVIAGGFIDWWYIGAGCRNQWNVWICDWTGDRNVASMQFYIPGVSRTDADFAALKYYMGTNQLGFVCQQDLSDTPKSQLYLSTKRCSPTTGNPIVTGHGNRIWHFRLFGAGAGITPSGEKVGLGASAQTFIIKNVDIMLGRFVVTTYKYPKGTTFNINIFFNWETGTVLSVPRATKLTDILVKDETQLPFSQWTCPGASGTLCQTGAAGPLWFYDDASELLYIRVVNPSLYRKTSSSPPNQGLFTWGGAFLPRIETNAYFKIETTCSALCTDVNLCANGDNWLSLDTTFAQNRVLSQTYVSAPVLDRFCNGSIPMDLKVRPAPDAPPADPPAPTPIPPINNSVQGVASIKVTYDPVVSDMELEGSITIEEEEEERTLAAAKRADSNELASDDQERREIHVEEGRAAIAAIRATEIINNAKAVLTAAKKAAKELREKKRSLQALKKSASVEDVAEADWKIAEIRAKLEEVRATITTARATIKSSETEYQEAVQGIEVQEGRYKKEQTAEKKLEGDRQTLQKQIDAVKKKTGESTTSNLQEKAAAKTQESDSDDVDDGDDGDDDDDDDGESDAEEEDDEDDDDSDLEALFAAEV